jgi:hypothetical protein
MRRRFQILGFLIFLVGLGMFTGMIAGGIASKQTMDSALLIDSIIMFFGGAIAVLNEGNV